MKINFSKIAGLSNEDKFISNDEWLDQIGSIAVRITDDEAEGLKAKYWDADREEDREIFLTQSGGTWGWWRDSNQIYDNGWATPAGAIVAAYKFFTNFELS